MSAPTMAEQVKTMRAAADMAAAFVSLPGGHVEVNKIYPRRIVVSLHDGLDTFEAWREALRIPEAAVRLTQGASNAYLTAIGEYGGAEVVVTAYSSPIPAGGAR